MHILAIVDKVTGEIKTVNDPVTGEKKEHQHLIEDPATKAIWDSAMTTELDRLLDTNKIESVHKHDVP